MAGTYVSDLGNLLYAGLDAVFNSALKAPRQTYYKNIVNQKSVGKKYGWYETIGAMGAAYEKLDGAAYTFDKIEDGAFRGRKSKERKKIRIVNYRNQKVEGLHHRRKK